MKVNDESSDSVVFYPRILSPKADGGISRVGAPFFWGKSACAAMRWLPRKGKGENTVLCVHLELAVGDIILVR